MVEPCSGADRARRHALRIVSIRPPVRGSTSAGVGPSRSTEEAVEPRALASGSSGPQPARSQVHRVRRLTASGRRPDVERSCALARFVLASASVGDGRGGECRLSGDSVLAARGRISASTWRWVRQPGGRPALVELLATLDASASPLRRSRVSTTQIASSDGPWARSPRPVVELRDARSRLGLLARACYAGHVII